MLSNTTGICPEPSPSIYTIFPRYVDLETWIKTEITKLGDQLFLAMLWFAQFGLRGYFSWNAAKWPLGCNWPMFAISRQWLFSTEPLCAVPKALNWLLRSSVAECFVDESLSSANAASAGARSRMSAHPQVKSWNEEKHEVQKILDRAAETCLLKPVRL